MDFNKADQLTNKLIESFFGKMKLNKAADVRHRFLGAATPKGAVDFVPNLTEEIPKRYFIKGRPGSGKSTMLKKLATAAEDRGVDVEVYHCGFDPHSLDMVIFRELGIAIFDSTAPHEYFPSRDGDEIIDMYEILIDQGTDDLFAEIISKIAAKYRSKMTEATSYLAKAKALHDELEAIYIEAMDFSIVEKIGVRIAEEIEELAVAKW
jgi:Cdc6-like AAA superfamily ATPase